MNIYYPLYARQTARHKWHLQTVTRNVTRALNVYLKVKQDAPSWEYALGIIGAEYFDTNENDNLRAIPFNLLDIDAELCKPFEMICPTGAQSDIGAPYSQHHLPISVTWDNLRESGGYVECDCGDRMVLYADYLQSVKR